MDLGDLLRTLQSGASAGPVNWDIATQCARTIAGSDPDTGETTADGPVDDADSDLVLELVRVAQTHVAALSGLAEVGAIPARAVTRAGWTAITLVGLRPVLEALASTLTGGAATGFDPQAFAGASFENFASFEAAAEQPEMLAGLMGALAPVLFGVQAGSLVGLLAQHALGQHDLPLPLAGEPQLAFIVDNIRGFARDWEIELRDLAFTLALREVVRGAPRSVVWVRERLVRLSSDYVAGYEMRPDVIEERLGDLLPPDLDFAAFDMGRFNLGDPTTLPEVPALDIDPTALLDGLRSPAQEPARDELRRLGCVLEGYADTVVEHLSTTLAPGTMRVDEALRRHRVEHGRHTAFVEKMLGLALDRADYERGAAFCAGVVERAGIAGLNRLWEREEHLPTPNELAAPGLWLARIDLVQP